MSISNVLYFKQNKYIVALGCLFVSISSLGLAQILSSSIYVYLLYPLGILFLAVTVFALKMSNQIAFFDQNGLSIQINKEVTIIP